MNHLEAQLIASKAQEAATVHRVKELEGIVRHMHNEHDQHTRSYEQLSTSHEALSKQFQYLLQTNETLRHAVADSYRSHKTEMERALQAQATDLQLEVSISIHPIKPLSSDPLSSDRPTCPIFMYYQSWT